MDPSPTAENPLPTTTGQAAMWYADQREGADGSYSVTVVWTVGGDVAAARIAGAWSRVQRETPALRMRMGLDRAGAVVQWLSSEELALDHADFQDRPEGGTEGAAFLTQRSAQAFDSDGGPLARLVCARVRRDVTVVALVAHHLIVDGLSQVYLARRFAAALLPPGGEPSSQHYAAVTGAVRQAEARTREADRAYWVPRVAGFLGGADWFTGAPTAHPGYASGGVSGDGLALLVAAAHDLGVTVYLLVAAAVHRALSIAGAGRTVVCSSVSVRPSGGAHDDVVGCFVNVIPLTASHAPGETLGDLVRRESAGWRRDHRHRHLSLLDIAGTDGAVSGAPNRLDRVFLGFRQTDPTLTWTGPGLTLSAGLANRYPATKSDLQVRFFRGADRLHYELEWSAATGWGAVFAEALEACLKSPDR